MKNKVLLNGILSLQAKKRLKKPKQVGKRVMN